MQILADECIRRSLVEALREAGHDVLWAREAMPGAPDVQVIARACEDDRVLLTADKDFGEIGLRATQDLPGIVLLRFPAAAWTSAAE